MMGEKKKIKNKENCQPVKKHFIQQINYTQQLHIPTLNTIDIKNLGKSTDLKKTIPNKKSISRKSRCISVKQTCASVKQGGNIQLLKYKNLFKRFQQLKGLQQRVERTKSKSSKSIRQGNKSRSPGSFSKIKVNNKKFNLTALQNKNLNKNYYSKTEFNSRMSLTNKLQRTLKKINQNGFFDRDEDDSLIPFVSTSEVCNSQELGLSKAYYLQNQQQDDESEINIFQMRKFCKNLQSQYIYQNTFKKSIDYFKGNQYEMMATKIQRAWRTYRTKKLVQRYADAFFNNYVQEVYSEQHLKTQNNSNQESQSDISSELKYKEKSFLKKQDQDFIFLSQMNKNYNFKHYQSDQSNKFQDQNISQKDYKPQQLKQDLLQSQKLYNKKTNEKENLITFISNLEDDSNDNVQIFEQTRSMEVQNNDKNIFTKQKQLQQTGNESYNKLINQMKESQIQKWNQVIKLLEENKQKKNPAELQKLFRMLERTSEKNKKELQYIKKQKIIASNFGQVQCKPNDFSRKLQRKEYQDKNQDKFQYESQCQNKNQYEGQNRNQTLGKYRDLNRIVKRQQSGPSETSDLKKEEEFDSRKYIQYLDSDIFLGERDKSSQNSEAINDERFQKRISKRKQKQLLAVLNIDDAPIRLRRHCVSKSQNLNYLLGDQSLQLPNIRSLNRRLGKSISQKNIQKVIHSISPQLIYSNDQFEEDHLNLDLIRQQFLESADPVEQLQKFHSNEQLKMKIKQSLLSQGFNYQPDEEEPDRPPRISINLQKAFNIQNQNFYGEDKIERNVKQADEALPVNFGNQKNKVIVIQNIDKNIEEQNIYENEEDDQEKQKIENLCFIVYNTLILEVLKQIASYDSILQKFKDYSLAMKAQQKQTKKGFQTNHNEVKSYVEGIISHLLNQQPQVFKNLEIPAGPTALQMLHYMHPNQYDDNEDEDSDISQDQTSVMVIPNRMFDKYWTIRQKNLKFQVQASSNVNPPRKKRMVQELKNLTKVFYRSIFDTFNECLDLERNYGQAGQPYPWKKTSSFHHTKQFSEIQKSISNSQKRINEIATTYCGLIIEKNQMARITMEGSDDYILHVQEDRMSRMLAQDLIQGEERWTFYDDEELELLVQIGNYITIKIIQETAEELGLVFFNRI